jgi:hypothetical protein
MMKVTEEKVPPPCSVIGPFELENRPFIARCISLAFQALLLLLQSLIRFYPPPPPPPKRTFEDRTVCANWQKDRLNNLEGPIKNK